MNKLIILDRDGVINADSADFIKSPEEWHALPGSLEAILKLNLAGYKVAIATNQSGIGRGLFDLSMLERIHQKLHDALAQFGAHIDHIFVCPHAPEAECECRKPKPGLFNQIFSAFDINPLHTQIYAIGDSLRDLQSAYAANCIPILVLTGNGEKTSLNLPKELKNIQTFSNLLTAVEAILMDKTDENVLS